MRNFDWRTPEEKNRTMVDHMSDYIYAYLPGYRDNLLLEGIEPNRVEVVGNIIVDTINAFIDQAAAAVKDHPHIFATIHREENTTNPKKFKAILDALDGISKTDLPVELVLIPSSRQRAMKLCSDGDYEKAWPNIHFIRPFGFVDCLTAQLEAKYIVTDSGSLQEEACILGKPCLVLRASTERSETIKCGATIISEPNDIDDIIWPFEELKNIKPHSWKHPLGDGKTSERIIESLKNIVPNLPDRIPERRLNNLRVKDAIGLTLPY
jgi:UDP-N-acetylglucosamine 2-epimerase (non-hydrolysing)